MFGRVFKEYWLLLNDDLKDVVSDFVDVMDLLKYDVDEDGYVFCFMYFGSLLICCNRKLVDYVFVDEVYNLIIYWMN